MGKVYVVWVGRQPGIYFSWDECRAEVENFPGARYKGFQSREDAIRAYRESDESAAAVLRSIAGKLKADEEKANPAPDYTKIPGVIAESIAVDAGCRGNPGIMEYRGVYVRTGKEIFKIGPYRDGTNNIGEFLAIVHGLALLKQKGSSMPVYSDSKVAQKWVREKKCRTKLIATAHNGVLFDLIRRAENWLATNTYTNPILKWDTDRWGEIPADFGRKG